MTRLASQSEIEMWNKMIGCAVWKKRHNDTSVREPKPFKSGLKKNTVTGIVKHAQTSNLAFVFLEDDSQVECWRCSVVS